jgi:phosphatidylglycerophosphate synthase
VLRTNALVERADLERLGDQHGRLISPGHGPLPAGIVPLGKGDPEAVLEDLPPHTTVGVAGIVNDRASARAMENALWKSLTSSSDGWVDRVFNRPVGRPLARLLIRTPVTPNAITLSATALGLLAAGLFAIGGAAWGIAAALLFQVSAIVDCIDGDVARAVFKESSIGKWLDLVGDQVVHIAVFMGIAVGLRGRIATGPDPLLLGAVAAGGALLSFAVVLRGMRTRRNAAGQGSLQRLLDAATNRDFSVLVLFLAIVERTEWFLWLAAAGSHVFWMACLLLQRGARNQRTLQGPTLH